MAFRTVTVVATSIGGQAGPFNITDDLGNTVATNVSQAQILAGVSFLVDTLANTLFLTSTGRCDNTTSVVIQSVQPSPTPTATVSISATATPTPTPTVTKTPSISISISTTPTVTPSISVTPTRTPSISITPTNTASPSTTPTPTSTPTNTPTNTPTPTVTPSTSPITGIVSCAQLAGTNVYLKATWTGAGSSSNYSAIFDGNGYYCGDEFLSFASVTIEFFSDSALTTPVSLSNIYIFGQEDNTLASQAFIVSANPSLNVGTLTSGQTSIVLPEFLYYNQYPDLTQNETCTNVNVYYGLNLQIGCSDVSTVTVQQNNNFQ